MGIDPFPAIVKITDLPLATTMSGTELLEAVQSSRSVAISISQIASAAAHGLPTAGNTGQILQKISSANFSAAWVNLDDVITPGVGLTISSTATTISVALSSANALSVLGNLAPTQGAITPIAGQAGQALRVTDAAGQLGFGTLNINSGSTVTGTLRLVNGGLGFTTAAASSIVGFSSTSAATAYAVGQLPGIATSADAAAGNIGEYLSTSLPFASAKGLTNGVATSVISLALTPGDWDLSCTVGFTGTTTTVAWYMAGSLSNTSTALNTTLGEAISVPCFGLAVFTSTSVINTPTFGFPIVRRSLSASATQWLTAQMAFTTSTAGVYGSITARRVR